MNYIVELSKDSHEHELVNSCALFIWQEVFDQDSQFFGSRFHKQALEEFLPDLKINAFHAIDILPRIRGNKWQWIKIYLNELATVSKIFKNVKNNDVKNIVFLSISPFALLFAKLHLKISPVKANVIFTFHGELQFLIQPNLRLSERLLQLITKINLSVKTKNTYYLVYGKTIKERLKYLFPKVLPYVVSLEHPFKANDSTTLGQQDLLTIGAFGAISRHKNAHKIVELATTVHGTNPHVHFKLVGKFIDHIVYPKNIITIVGGDEFLSRNDYEKELVHTSWLIYLYEDRNYELIASGAFLDAILYDKPVICLRNRFFEHVFEHYQIGLMVDRIESFPAEITKLFDREDLQTFYLECQNNIKRYRDDYQLFKQGGILKDKLVEQINFKRNEG